MLVSRGLSQHLSSYHKTEKTLQIKQTRYLFPTIGKNFTGRTDTFYFKCIVREISQASRVIRK